MPTTSYRAFKTRYFARWMRKTELTDTALINAVDEMQQGLIDAKLGGNLFKKRVALPGKGKRASTRTIVATNLDDRWFFTDGFEKNEKDNLEADELKAAKKTAKDLLTLNDKALEILITARELEELTP